MFNRKFNEIYWTPQRNLGAVDMANPEQSSFGSPHPKHIHWEESLS